MHLFSKFEFFKSNSNPFIKTFTSSNFTGEFRKLYFSDFLGKSTIVSGETGVGKTEFTTEFVNYLTLNDDIVKVFIIDMAPEFFMLMDRRVGGKILDYNSEIALNPKVEYQNCINIIPPRSFNRTADDVILAAKKNYEIIHPKLKILFDKFQELCYSREKKHTAIVINDLSMYFHQGSFDSINKILNLQKSYKILTIFMNTYFGINLIEDHGSKISQREKKLTELTTKKVDISINLIKHKWNE